MHKTVLICTLAMAFVCSAANQRETPFVLSSQMRVSDPTVMDIVYKVVSDKPTVNVRALAFEDGKRSFWKVVRPETFVKDADGNETAQNIGDGIAANVEHKLAWKVSADWKTDLAKVKFEVLTSEMTQLPLKTINIPATEKNPSLIVALCDQSATDVFNALLWYYADGATDVYIQDGSLYLNSRTCLANRSLLSDQIGALSYVYRKIGYEPMIGGELLDYVRGALRKNNLYFNSSVRNIAVRRDTIPTTLYVGEKMYWAIDLETGEQEYISSVPLAGWSNEYKTTKLLFRYVAPGSFTMQVSKRVTLTRPFYIGVFEVTQKQFQLIANSNPSLYKGDLRPVARVSYNMLRGNTRGAEWPLSSDVDDSSWIGMLRASLKVRFDLPTEAQWEYSCRAGTTSDYNNGGSAESDLAHLGRYLGNQLDGSGGCSQHTIVGSYIPNLWGLYDMHGNVGEWCLDKSNGDLSTAAEVDPAGPSVGNYRVLRGDNWAGYYTWVWVCNSRTRTHENPSSADSSIYKDCYGFRLVFNP